MPATRRQMTSVPTWLTQTSTSEWRMSKQTATGLTTPTTELKLITPGKKNYIVLCICLIYNLHSSLYLSIYLTFSPKKKKKKVNHE